MSSDLETLEDMIGYRFHNRAHLERALTRKKLSDEKSQKKGNDEKPIPHQLNLCTLGDAVLKLILVEELIRRGAKNPGRITKDKMHCENRISLGEIARDDFDLCNMLRTTKGEEKDGVRKNLTQLGESLEAVIAAIYLDSDYAQCQKTILAWEGIQRKLNSLNQVK